jgi:hypothetical protein
MDREGGSMKALTFLGAGRYETVTYVWEERSHTTRLFPEALARIFEPEKVIVFVTETAKELPSLRVGQRAQLCQKCWPRGANSAIEDWEIRGRPYPRRSL